MIISTLLTSQEGKETSWIAEKMKTILLAGVDKVGRGPLAGPLIAAAVILNPKRRIKGLADSKQLTALQRDDLYQHITQKCLAYAIGRAEIEEIERLNIHYANLLAMQRAVMALTIAPDSVLVDGIDVPNLRYLYVRLSKEIQQYLPSGLPLLPK